MFTDNAQTIIDRAKDYAFNSAAKELDLPSMVLAACHHPEGGVLLAECIAIPLDQLRAALPVADEPTSCAGKLRLAEATRTMLKVAKELAEEIPDHTHPGLIGVRHLVCAMAFSREVCALLKVNPLGREAVVKQLAAWHEAALETPRLDELTERLQSLRNELLSKVFGQDHAVHAFVEGLFNAEVVAAADVKRRAPRAVFVFAGPPGVGKTYLAELGAAALNLPFKRFDMSAYSGHQQNEQLVGVARNYQGAHPGTLTEFVEKNPNAVLLFDEIEKSHSKTIHLFLQALDAGTLEDKFHERNVNFRDTTIIFTTNAGRKLYDRPNASGVHKANASFHRKTIIDALETEIDPLTREPFFPAALCSRLATGYPVLFNHLRVNELERVVRAELLRVSGLFERQYFKSANCDKLLPTCLVLREGARADARTLRSQTEAFFKTEIFKFCQLFKTERLEEVLAKVERIAFALEDEARSLSTEVRALFEPPEKPKVLLVADADLTDLYREGISKVDWRTASTVEGALQTLAEEDVDMVLLDLWMGRFLAAPSETIQYFDHAPAAAHGLDQGQELLQRIHSRLPGMPVFLLSLTESDETLNVEGTVDDELFTACVRGGGARGLIVSQFIDGLVFGWEKQRDALEANLVETCHRLYREKAADKMGRERKVLTFDTVPHLSQESREITIRLRNLSLTRAIAAADAGEVLDDVERPTTKFEDVIGADTAKEELQFFIDYLKNPRRFAALGLKPPKGVLLHGPPGTGKTMLARAMACESDVAFIPVSAANFVTIWQGSGPQNVKALFDRARRYAPSIIFIDEIDAIGRVRSGSTGTGHGEEMALNALLTEMDGFTGPSPDRPVFVLAATNFKVDSENEAAPERSTRTLDPALVRRFSRNILVDLPDTAARQKYFALRLGQTKGANITQQTILLLAEKSVGMSIANLEQVIETAGRHALQRNLPLSDDLLLETLDTAREGEAKEWSPEFLESTARHEAGHTTMYWLSGWLSPEVSIVARADHGGGMRRSEEEMKRESLTREELLARIRTCLGGRAAEILYHGKEKGLTTGASGDLEHATQIARNMICRYGMEEDFGMLSTPELFKHAEAVSSPLYQRVSESAVKILNQEMENTLKLLEENHNHLDAVSKALLAKNRLYRNDLQQLLPPCPCAENNSSTTAQNLVTQR
jgi:ATP-dependent metalloprotease FtsH